MVACLEWEGIRLDWVILVRFFFGYDMIALFCIGDMPERIRWADFNDQLTFLLNCVEIDRLFLLEGEMDDCSRRYG